MIALSVPANVQVLETCLVRLGALSLFTAQATDKHEAQEQLAAAITRAESAEKSAACGGVGEEWEQTVMSLQEALRTDRETAAIAAEVRPDACRVTLHTPTNPRCYALFWVYRQQPRKWPNWRTNSMQR